MNTSARTNANPLYDLAREYALPLEQVYCMAWRYKQIMMGTLPTPDYWGDNSVLWLQSNLGFMFDEFKAKLYRLMDSFLLKQRWL